MRQHPDPFELPIAKHYADLSPQLKRAAQFVMDHPEDVATRSLRQVAGKSGLTPPTFSRLARAIGFDEYEALRDSCRNHLEQTRLSLAQRAALMQDKIQPMEPGQTGDFALSHARAMVANIQALMDNLDQARLAAAVEKLVAAREVVLIGTASSKAMVEYLSHMANFVMPNWSVAGAGGKSTSAMLSQVGPEDAVIAVSVAPYLRRTVELVDFAERAGATTIVLTDDIRSPALKFSTFSFMAPTESPQFYPSHVAMLMLLEVMMGMAVRRLGREAQLRIESIEKANHAIGDYW